MEMYSHQNVAHSHDVANSQASRPARRGVAALSTAQASTTIDSSCSHHSGSPPHGHASENACATPATSINGQSHHALPARA